MPALLLLMLTQPRCYYYFAVFTRLLLIRPHRHAICSGHDAAAVFSLLRCRYALLTLIPLASSCYTTPPPSHATHVITITTATPPRYLLSLPRFDSAARCCLQALLRLYACLPCCHDKPCRCHIIDALAPCCRHVSVVAKRFFFFASALRHAVDTYSVLDSAQRYAHDVLMLICFRCRYICVTRYATPPCC